MKNAQEIEKQIQKIKAALAEERESIDDFETLIGQRIDGELWELSEKALEKAAWDSFFFLERNKDCLEDEPVASHRRFYGAVIVFFKRLFRGLMRPYTKMILARQCRFDRELIQLQLANLLRMEKMGERVAALEAKAQASRTEKG